MIVDVDILLTDSQHFNTLTVHSQQLSFGTKSKVWLVLIKNNKKSTYKERDNKKSTYHYLTITIYTKYIQYMQL